MSTYSNKTAEGIDINASMASMTHVSTVGLIGLARCTTLRSDTSLSQNLAMSSPNSVKIDLGSRSLTDAMVVGIANVRAGAMKRMLDKAEIESCILNLWDVGLNGSEDEESGRCMNECVRAGLERM